MARQAQGIRVGIGGWKYPPWRGRFYPEGLPQREELAFASRQVSAIEVNSTYYGTQKPATFAQWREETPDDFVFSLKAPRHATQRRVLAEAAGSIERFIASGIAELGPKLGPLVWQFPPTHAFEPGDFEAFLDLLPESVEGLPLRHVLDVRHDSFRIPEFLALARRHRCATVFTDSPNFPSFADLTRDDLVYARLMCSQPDVPTGYCAEALERLVDAARTWAQGGEPEGPPRIAPPAAAGGAAPPRDVFLYFIDGAKENAPAAATALLARWRSSSPAPA